MQRYQKICVVVFLVLMVNALFSSPLAAQKLRERIKNALLQKIDAKALQQDVDSTLYPLEYDGYQRSYYLYVPKSWDKKTPIPVVFLFHGGGGGARGALYSYELEKKAEEAGFLLVAPNGTGESKNILLTWNVEFGFGFAQKNKVNDIGFVNALLDKLEKEYPVDQKRIYATGMSNGAIFCHFLAAQPGSRFAAIAPVVGTVGGKEQNETDWHTPPRPQVPVSVCMIQGLLDQHVSVKGGLQEKSVTEPKILMSASDTIDFWVNANTCNPVSVSTYDESMKTTIHNFGGGRNGTEVITYVIHNMGHAWPGSTRVPRKGSDKPAADFPGNEIIWKFFSTHPRR